MDRLRLSSASLQVARNALSAHAALFATLLEPEHISCIPVWRFGNSILVVPLLPHARRAVSTTSLDPDHLVLPSTGSRHATDIRLQADRIARVCGASVKVARCECFLSVVAVRGRALLLHVWRQVRNRRYPLAHPGPSLAVRAAVLRYRPFWAALS